MTLEQFQSLGIGDLIRHKSKTDDEAVVVTTRNPDSVIATKTYPITNPYEWVLVAVSTYKSPHQQPKQQ